jgi:LysM repeat protein
MSATSAFHEFFPLSVSGEHEAEVAHPDQEAPAREGSRASYCAGENEARCRVQAPLRLTRRGWIVLVVLPLMLLAAFLMSLSGFLTSPAKAADTVSQLSVTPTLTVTVQQGQSLWAIAGTVAPERDPRDVVADIVQLNNLDGGAVNPGQQLFVPST